jgi:chaperone required for assembly of F1-ATPase
MLGSPITASFPEQKPEALVELQTTHWSPIFKWVKSKHGVDVRAFESVFQTTQSQETLTHFEGVLVRMDSWTLAGTVWFAKLIYTKLTRISDGTCHLCY